MPMNNTPQTFNLGAGFKFKGGGGGGPGGVRIEHRVGIQTPPDVIWDLIYDLDGWKDWNPLYPEASGQIRIGAPLSLKLAVPGEAVREIQPTVLEWVPREQLHWRLKMLGGLVNNTRYIEIEQLAPASCIVANGELFGGFLGQKVAARMGGKVFKGFEEMSLALKAAAEARWQAQANAPKS